MRWLWTWWRSVGRLSDQYVSEAWLLTHGVIEEYHGPTIAWPIRKIENEDSLWKHESR